METGKREKGQVLKRTGGLKSAVRAARWMSQIGFFALFLFLVIGTVCAVTLTRGIVVSEPLGVIQLIIARGVSNSPFFILSETVLIGSAVFVGVTILLGRAFCAWACPLGTVIDGIDTVLEKLKFRPFFARRLSSKEETVTASLVRNGINKYAVLGAVLTGSVGFKFPVWCTICPIGTLCRGAVSGAEAAVGSWVLAIPAVTGALSLGDKRFWCRYLCPVGALLTLVSRINPLIKPRIREEATRRDCGACRIICPEGIDICNERSFARCTKCLECYVKCPYGSVRIAFV